ncbi:phosphomannomutase [Rheinheimera sp.]|uniref:phosphomannomutase n=1 Tax=Rheinheimera sp. TaxID=1869214 RepID=UPI00307E93B4
MTTLVSNKVIGGSGIQFGTSGARGLVVDFTPEVCAAFSLAFLRVVQQSSSVERMALAIDNRPSSPEMAAHCAALLQQQGIAVDYYGVVPTPALAYAAMQQKVPAIMVTGSHIPFDRNGLKFYRPEGEITKQDELAMLSQAAEFSWPLPPVSLAVSGYAASAYQQRYLQWFAADLAKNLRVGVYEHSSAGRDIYAPLLQQFGATVIALGRSDSFVPIDTEAVSAEDEARARQWAKQHQLDMIFSTDGDGDRPLVADEKGQWFRGDILCLLAAKALGVEALAVPVSCNTAIEGCGAFSQVTRTKIGSPYVIAGFEQLTNYRKVAGFEANGGFLLASDLQAAERLLKALPTRDALLPFLAIVQLAQGKPLSLLLNELPQRFTASDRITNFATEKSKALLVDAQANIDGFAARLQLNSPVVSVDTTDGLRLILENADIVHLRPSGNAPELRCYAESDSNEKARSLVQHVLCCVSSLA